MISVDGRSLSILDLVSCARDFTAVQLDPEVETNVRNSRQTLERLTRKDSAIYGVTTAFGENAVTLVPAKYERDLQNDLIRKHAVGVGEVLPTDAVRAIILARLNCLARGHSGVRYRILEFLRDMLNNRLHPKVPSQGTVSASGDLAPLSHIALSILGEGLVEYEGRTAVAEQALVEAGMKPISLSWKEGLALVNGTSGTTGLAGLIVDDAHTLFSEALDTASMSFESLKGNLGALSAPIHDARNNQWQAFVANSMRDRLKNSRFTTRPETVLLELDAKVKEITVPKKQETIIQDCYSLRCIPQVLGPCFSALDYVTDVVTHELNSTNDNPLFLNGAVFHGGNFHAMNVSMCLDLLKIALSVVGTQSNRRVTRLLDRHYSRGLPGFLAEGYSCGLEGLEYVSTSLVSENMQLANPNCTLNVESNARNQDVVSMGMIAAMNARRMLRNLHEILHVERVCSTKALEMRAALNSEPSDRDSDPQISSGKSIESGSKARRHRRGTIRKSSGQTALRRSHVV